MVLQDVDGYSTKWTNTELLEIGLLRIVSISDTMGQTTKLNMKVYAEVFNI